MPSFFGGPGRYVLAVDTATPAVTAAVVAVLPAGGDRSGVRTLASRGKVDARAHGELLAPSVAAVLGEAGIGLPDLAAVVVGLGPGPYTGLRVGLVTAAALADAVGIPVYGVCSLDTVAGLALAARTRPAAGDPGRLLVATDARRREVYWALYDDTGARISGPAVDRPAVLADRLPGIGVTLAAGAGARQYADVLGVPVTGPDYPDPAAAVAAVRDRILAGAPSDQLTPLYLRRPDAELPGRLKQVTPR